MRNIFEKITLPEEAFPEAFTYYNEHAEEDAFDKIRAKWNKEQEALVDHQIREQKFVKINDRDGNAIRMEVRYLDPTPLEKSKRTLAMIAGWGASYKRISEMGKVIAMEGDRQVVLLSLPGVGNSDDPPKAWLKKNDFDYESDTALKAIEAAMAMHNDTQQDISLLGHSMGGMIATQIAKDHPERVRDLVLLHTAGVKEESPASLVSRFIINGGYEMLSKYEKYLESGFDPKWLTELEKKKKVDKKIVENLLGVRRFQQHFGKEVRALAKGGIKDIIKDVKANLLVVSGTEEKLFPPQESCEIAGAAKNAKQKVVSVLHGAKHGDPMMWHDIYGMKVAHYLDMFEQSEKQDK